MSKKEVVKESTFSKSQIIGSNKYKHKRDILTVLLNDDTQYSISKVDKIMNDYMKGSVK